ncbi:M1 family metallopeptidase [Pseudosporangium ferrugineum]|uniref:Aminopeptidase N n=1 Tax=Pseudosporangium ferrugineum TaxID=439699 RepID=A0A2T0RJJ5_9ACTN|nr:M1 family metallopeptidase [Pseudosporangium ferrugineum]PRY21301.1 peptidase M1-like protein [Pseudosporangium ferrugineum]
MRNKIIVAATTAALLGVATWIALPSASASTVADPYFPDDGNPGVDVLHYDVAIGWDKGVLSGDTTLTIKATAKLPEFHLDLSGLTVSAVDVDGRAAKFRREGAHELVITPAKAIVKGAQFKTRIRYGGKPTGEGWHVYPNGGALALGEPHSATSWYPADDHPSDKATFHLTATVPDGWTAIGNGEPEPVRTAKGKTVFRWNEDRPVATYLTTVAIDKFTVRRSKMPDGTPMLFAYGDGIDPRPESEAAVPKIIKLFSKLFGPYPFASVGAIAVNGVEAGNVPQAIETQRRPTFQGGFFDVSLSHELAHQWFGNNVSFTDWRDGCIAECFAQYANQLWEEAEYDSDLDNFFYAAMLRQSLDDPDFWSVRLYDPGPGRELHPALYDKGSMMLHALRRMVGDDAFFGTLKRWQRDHRDGNASFPDFEKLAAQVSGKNLTGFFAEWAHSTTEPSDANLRPGSLAGVQPLPSDDDSDGPGRPDEPEIKTPRK